MSVSNPSKGAEPVLSEIQGSKGSQEEEGRCWALQPVHRKDFGQFFEFGITGDNRSIVD